MLAGGLVGQEEAGGLDDVIRADLVPLEVGGVALGGDADGLAVNDELAVLDLDGALEAAVGRVILEHVSHVVGVEQVVNTYNLDVVALAGGAEDETADASETVDTDLDCHVESPLVSQNYQPDGTVRLQAPRPCRIKIALIIG